MTINVTQPLINQNNNSTNISRKVNVDNTYSVQNKVISDKPQSQIGNANFIDAVNSERIRDARTEVNEIRNPDTNNIRESEPKNNISELSIGVKKTEKSQIRDIENLNANVAQGIKPVGTGSRLINGFLRNNVPNLGGKVDTLV